MTVSNGRSCFAMNDGVRLHYHIRGAGRPVVMLHGFPEYWKVWRHQIDDLSRNYCVIVPDLRGFNLSDRPQGVQQYTARAVAGDVLAILRELSVGKVALVGHDIGGMIAWWIASYHPDRVERLALLSAPHPVEYVIGRRDPTQRKASLYVDELLGSAAVDLLRPERLSFWIEDRQMRAELEEALTRSDLQAVANYFRANLFDQSELLTAGMPRVGCRTLVLYGSQDRFVLRFIYRRTHVWVEGPLTIKELAGEGHFIHHDAAAAVTTELRKWLAAA